MTQELTRSLGAFTSRLRFKDVPADALPVIRTGFTDCVGVLIAGREEPAVQLLRRALRPAGGESRLLFGDGTASAPDAAWINGTAAHALDFDDVAQRGHPSTVLVPAILAEAEVLDASGQEMMAAYAAGYETWAELVRRDPDPHHFKGWHPTGVFGAVAAAAACARLLELDADGCARAIAIGASQAAGLMSNFGTMTKPFHAGRSAHAGLLAARLAAAGFTGSLDALEHPQGFLSAISVKGRIDFDSPVQAGQPWKLQKDRISVKKYPLCYCTHRALDAVLELLDEVPVAAQEVREIRVSTSPRNATILRNALPQTGLEAKFSMQFAMASAIVARRAGLGELTDTFVQRAEVQALLPRVHVDIDEREDPVHPGWAPHDFVTITTRDGRQLKSRAVTEIRGGAELPLDREESWAKFDDCARAGGMADARRLFDALMALEQLPSARGLART